MVQAGSSIKNESYITYLDEFLKHNYTLLTHCVEIIAALTGLLCYKKYEDTNIKYFIWFLVYVVIIELIGSYPNMVRKYDVLNRVEVYLQDSYFEKNYWFYTLFWSIGSALFYSYYYQKILNIKTHIRAVRILTSIFIVSSIIYLFLNPQDFFNRSIPFIKIFGAIIILLCAIFYFYEILKSDRLLLFYKSINFFISAIIFIWWLVTTPVLFYQVYHSTADWNFVFLRWQIFLFMNIFMYLTFAFAFIWCEPQNDLE